MNKTKSYSQVGGVRWWDKFVNYYYEHFMSVGWPRLFEVQL